MNEIKERPILFSGPMVRAILEGRKTQTRRTIRNPERLNGLMNVGEEEDWCPYGRIGDRLWVREGLTLWPGTCAEYSECSDGTWIDIGYDSEKQDWLDNYARAKVPSIHMPRWASRITLEVCSVRVERVQEISERDAFAEGYDGTAEMQPDYDPIAWYRDLWNSINANRGFGWNENPWVWVIEFRRVEQRTAGSSEHARYEARR